MKLPSCLGFDCCNQLKSYKCLSTRWLCPFSLSLSCQGPPAGTIQHTAIISMLRHTYRARNHTLEYKRRLSFYKDKYFSFVPVIFGTCGWCTALYFEVEQQESVFKPSHVCMGLERYNKLFKNTNETQLSCFLFSFREVLKVIAWCVDTISDCSHIHCETVYTSVCLFKWGDGLYMLHTSPPSQLTCLLSIKATNALLIWVILELQ